MDELIAEARAAFDCDDVVRKNVTLRQLHDALHAAAEREKVLAEALEMYAKDYPSGLNTDLDKAVAKARAAIATQEK